MDKIRETKKRIKSKYPKGFDRVKDVCKLLVTIACIKSQRLVSCFFIGGYKSDHFAWKLYPCKNAQYFRSRYGSVNKAKKLLLWI